MTTAGADTIFLTEEVSQLPEIMVESRMPRMLHILAYVREYSSLSTYTDTVFLFREKMVDFMLPAERKVRFKGWSAPRVLTSKSYYRFTDDHGLDSVSDVSRHHFSWSDWMGLAPSMQLPTTLTAAELATDTLRGRYSIAEIWRRNKRKIDVDVDVLSDTASRRWVPEFAGFFRKNIDFDKFKVNYNYDNVVDSNVSVLDLSRYSFDIESNDRGHSMFFFNKVNQPIYISTEAEVYVLDKEYITVKEARQWEKRCFDIDEVGIYEPMDAPELSASTLALIERVNNIDKEAVRLDEEPDRRMISPYDNRKNFRIGNRALTLLKDFMGITAIRSHRKANKSWKDFRKKQVKSNRGRNRM